MRTPWRGSTSAALFILVAILSVEPGRSQAQTPPAPSTQDAEWTVRDSMGFRSRNIPIGALFQMRVDGRGISPTWSSDRKGSPDSTERAPLDPKTDFAAEYKNKPVSVVREMRVDPRRRAVRIIDIFTNTESLERNLRVEYTTSLSERGSMRFGGILNQAGESREYGNGVPDDTVAALIFAERQDSQALPVFVWGQSGARWPVNIQDAGSSVTLSYEGVIPANGKVALLHWVAVAGMDKSIKLERTPDLFWKDGRLVDPMVSADVAPLVVNFAPDALKVTSPPSTSVAQAAGRLVGLEELCGKLSVVREDKDMLWMSKDEQFRGTVSGTTVQMRNADRTLELPLAGIAALRGGGGRGREHRVYLRDGSVLTGRATLAQCRLAGDLGELTLDADSLELLLLHVTPEDGKVPAGASAFAQMKNGGLFWLGRQEGVSFDLVTVFGSLPVSLNELWSMERRTEPPFNLIATLADGSRIHGVAQQATLTLPVLGADSQVTPMQVRTAELVRLGSAELLSREMALPSTTAPPTVAKDSTGGKPKVEPPARYCWLRDGSLLVGTLTTAPLKVRAGGNEVDIKPEDLARLTLDASNGNLASMELRSGAKMQGELLSESLGWHLGSRQVALPAGWVMELVRKDADAPVPLPPPSTARNPGENDPLAVPNMKREHMKEVKIDYPPSSVESSAPISGTVSLPRLDRCDAESVKKRLTFLVPGSVTNVALKKPVTVSNPESVVGVISSITDGSAKDDGGEHVSLGGGLQWVQIDLGEAHQISKILLWHYHRMPVVYEDVIVMVSDDPNFKKNVRTIFNNDHDDTAGFGRGPDIAYVETNYGWLIDGARSGGRYVRFYSRGNSYSEKNDYLEVMIFGYPRDPKFPPIDPVKMATSAVGLDPIYPKASFNSDKPIQIDTAKFPHLEKFEPVKDGEKKYVLVPRGTSLVSSRRPVTSSVRLEKPELLERVTDGDKEFNQAVELPAGLQWVQIDLGAKFRLRKILVWHEFQEPVAYHDVIVEVSDHPEFKNLQYRLFNNDHDNSSGKGQGRDHAYIESNYGRLIDAQNVTGRYVRLYSKGNSKDDLNRYCEVYVWGEKIEEDPADPSTANPPPAPNGPLPPWVNKSAIPPSPTTPNDPLAVPQGMSADQLVEEKPAYPPALYKDDGKYSFDKIPNLEKLTPEQVNARKNFLIPKGASIVSKGKRQSSRTGLEMGSYLSLNDGNADGSKGNYVEFRAGLQHVQIDLGATHDVWKVLLWHFHRYPCVYYDVIVQVSDDFWFSKGVQTIFNNDHDNSFGLGKGADPAYIETNYGRLIDGRGARGRYIRFYSQGNTANPWNSYVEISVYGTAVDPNAASTSSPHSLDTPKDTRGKRPSSTPAPAPSTASTPPSQSPPTAFPLPPKPEALITAEASKSPAAPNNPLAIPKGMTREQLVEEKPSYPKPMFVGTPVPTGDIPNLEKTSPEDMKMRSTFLVPKSAAEVARGKTVTSSDPLVIIGSIDLITDGDADGADGCYVELAPGLQWVQIDLGATHHIWKALLWHFHKQTAVYHDVVVQVSDDPKFAKEVQTIFNNDHDNSAKLGKGPDPAYVETNRGRLIDGCGTKGRYLRFYSHGSTANEMNHYIEAMVYGTPVKSSSTPAPSPDAVPTPQAPTGGAAHGSSSDKRNPFLDASIYGTPAS